MSDYTRPYLYPKQEAALFCLQRISCTEASTKSGKAQPLDSLIYTPSGPIKMGEVTIGQEVLGHNGKTYKVTGVFPRGMRQSYIVTFNDKTEVECDGEHLWETKFYDQPTEILTTLQLMQIPKWRFIRTNVPKISPVAFTSQEVPLDPYLIGVIIGDGNTTAGAVRIASTDLELLSLVASMLPPKHRLRKVVGDNCDYNISVAIEDLQDVRKDKGSIFTIMENLGMRGQYSYQKSIPKIYLYNTIDVRLALLQGIMDTDGSVNSKGQPILEQTSEQLAKDVKELVESLGGSVKTTSDTTAGYLDKSTSENNWVQGRRRYRQTIRLGDLNTECFRLSRKRDRLIPPKKTGNRLLNSIHIGRITEMQCISVDNPRCLYLTNGLIPTHNTVAAIAWIVEEALKGGEGHNFWWVAPRHDQAAIAYRRIKLALTKGSFVSFDTPTPRIKTIVGSWIWFKTSDDPDSLYGEDVYGAVLDEASRMKDESFYAVRSTVTATRGKIRAIGNVKGRKNWFYNLSRRAEAEMSEAQAKGEIPSLWYSKITADDAVAAGVLDQEAIDEARRDYPEQLFRELYYAEPSDDSGNPFGLEHIRACTRPILAPGPVVAWGLDLAKRQDYFVCIGLNAEGGVAAFDRWRGIPWRQSIRRAWALVGEDTPAMVDSTGVGDPVLEELQFEHSNFFGFNFSQTSKQKLMEGLAVSIQSHEITFPEGLIKYELELFEYEETRTGIRYSAPEGQNDDCVCSLALARQMWVEGVPGANVLKYYSDMTARLRNFTPNKPESPFKTLDSGQGNNTVIDVEDLVSNELEGLYNETVLSLLPSYNKTCIACGTHIASPAHVTDGEFFWHVECAGRGAGRSLTLSKGNVSASPMHS